VFREPFPILHVQDPERSARFYCDNFGFEQTFRWPKEGPLEFAFLQLGETGIGVASTAAPALPDWPQDRGTGSFQLFEDPDGNLNHATAVTSSMGS
jgi:catechol 2,3-dioxygenase-like lactoylglutathione lyase family enzyme